MKPQLTGKALVAAGHLLAKQIGPNTPLKDISALISSLATHLDVALVRGDQLQQQANQLAAENAALKNGKTYFAYSPEYGFDYFNTKQAAIDAAEAEISAYRDEVDDGWPDDVKRVGWGVVIQSAQGFDAQGIHTSDSQHTYQTCDYRLQDEVKTPATDAFLLNAQADGVDKVLERYSFREGSLTSILIGGFAKELRSQAEELQKGVA